MSAGGYIAFLRTHWRFAGFGACMAFSSSFGQTHFIGIFGPRFQAEFDLSHTAWSAIYMTGTLASALVLPYTGKFIDRLDLRHYALLTSLALGAACLFVAAVVSPVMLVFAIFGLRQSGQGLSSHVAQTAMARYFDTERGRAIAVTALGFALAEAVLPVTVVGAIELLGWRITYVGAALVQLVLFIPLLQWLLAGHPARHAAYLLRQQARRQADHRIGEGWTRAQVVRDVRFYLLMPGVFAPSVVLTAMFFHHLNVADAKGWSHVWITGNYVLYAGVTVVTSLLAGSLIDRVGAVRLVSMMLSPLAVGLVLLGAVDEPWVVMPYMVGCGITTGITYTGVSALWAELYGLAHLGAVRALAVALGVFGSALGPVAVGVLLDVGVAMDNVLYCLAAYVVVGALTLRIAVRWHSTPGKIV
jgi:MFS family permease